MKVNAPSCVKDLSHDFHITNHVKIEHYDQIVIKLRNLNNK
jgi:hypothetical protein